MSRALCALAFESLYSKLNPDIPSISFSEFLDALNDSGDLPKKSPLFVTWNKNDDLRGCIGTFRPLPVESGTRQYSLISALQDSRFPPIKKSELDKLSVSITLLDKFEEISKATDWEVGKHGLQLSFEYKLRHFSGTFLPVVAEEQEWDKVTTLAHLLRKAGFGGIGSDQVENFYDKGINEGWIELQRYEGLKDDLDYKEFIQIRESI